jgi:SAM-dependent methyltransferase
MWQKYGSSKKYLSRREVHMSGGKVQGLKATATTCHDEDFFKFLGQCLSEPDARLSSAGKSDKYLLQLAEHLESLTKPCTVLDYGCGNGPLVWALAQLPKEALDLIEYIGLDTNTRRLAECNKTIHLAGIRKSSCQTPEKFFNPTKPKKIDFAFCINTLHELPIFFAPSVICALLNALNDEGILLIRDMIDIPIGERGFVCWQETNYEALKTLGIDVTMYQERSKRTKTQIAKAYLRKTSKEFDELEIYLNVIRSFKEVREKELAERETLRRDKKGLKRFAFLSVQINNITQQLITIEKINDGNELASEIPFLCPVCLGPIWYGSTFDLDFKEQVHCFFCPRCTFEAGDHYSFGYSYVDANGYPAGNYESWEEGVKERQKRGREIAACIGHVPRLQEQEWYRSYRFRLRHRRSVLQKNGEQIPRWQ